MRLMTAIAATVLLACTSAVADATQMPRIGTTAIYFNAKGSVFVNGVPIRSPDSGPSGTTSVNENISMWLVEGANTVGVSVEPLKDNGKATLKVWDREGKQMATLQQAGAGRQSGTITVEGVPQWRWTQATPVAETAEGLAATVAVLHAAYGTGAIDDIVRLSEPFFTDSAKVGGMGADLFRTRAAPMLTAGKVQPLPTLTITRHADGRLFRVVGPDGQPPIALVLKRGEMSRAIRSGEWWSMLDGTWKVVR
jgi:hypothetical protein